MNKNFIVIINIFSAFIWFFNYFFIGNPIFLFLGIGFLVYAATLGLTEN